MTPVSPCRPQVIKATSGAVAAAARRSDGEGGAKDASALSLVTGLQDLVARAWLLRARCEADKGVLLYVNRFLRWY